MKNIHLLPTDKPSRLAYYQESTSYNKPILQLVKTISSDYKYQNIYITSNEEIKEGDSIFETDTNTINVAGKDYVENEVDFKIILTTDQDLIKNGVQAFDDEFLTWFVKNPTCEEVYITNDYEQVNQDNPITRGSTNVFHKYKIIIPSEPKQAWKWLHDEFQENWTIKKIN